MSSVLTRREFIQLSSQALTLTFIGGIWSCTSLTESNDEDSDSTTLTVISSYDAGHSHSISILRSLIDTPPSSDRSLTSTGSHTHVISLSVSDFQTLNTGGTVTKTSSTTNGHSHTFTIKA